MDISSQKGKMKLKEKVPKIQGKHHPNYAQVGVPGGDSKGFTGRSQWGYNQISMGAQLNGTKNFPKCTSVWGNDMLTERDDYIERTVNQIISPCQSKEAPPNQNGGLCLS